MEAVGGGVSGPLWAVGEYDGAIVFETPDEATTARLLMSLAKLRNVTTKSMRVHDEAEFRGVLTRVARFRTHMRHPAHIYSVRKLPNTSSPLALEFRKWGYSLSFWFIRVIMEPASLEPFVLASVTFRTCLE